MPSCPGAFAQLRFPSLGSAPSALFPPQSPPLAPPFPQVQENTDPPSSSGCPAWCGVSREADPACGVGRRSCGLPAPSFVPGSRDSGEHCSMAAQAQSSKQQRCAHLGTHRGPKGHVRCLKPSLHLVQAPLLMGAREAPTSAEPRPCPTLSSRRRKRGWDTGREAWVAEEKSPAQQAWSPPTPP